MDAFRIWLEETGRSLHPIVAGYDPSILLPVLGVVALALVVAVWLLSRRRRRQLILRLEALESDVRALVMDRERELLRQVKSQPKP